jgi:chromosome segregation ATPase
MRTVQTFKRIALAFLLVTLLGFTTLSSAFADETDVLKEKLAQLEQNLAGLEALVKTLTLQVQKVSEEAIGDLENFRPRLFTIEKVTKDNTFEIKKLSGTVAQLAETVDRLSDLPEKVKYLKESIAELNDALQGNVQTLSNRIATNELSIAKLQEAVERAVVVVNTFQENLGTIFGQLDQAAQDREQLRGVIAGLQAGLEGLAAKHDSDARGLQTGLESLSARVDSSIGTLAARLDDLEARISAMQDQLAQVESLQAAVSDFQTKLAQLDARAGKFEARLAQLQDMMERMKALHPKVQELAQALKQLDNQIKVNSRQLEEQAKQIQDNAARLDQLEAIIGRPDANLQRRVEKLEGKLQELVTMMAASQQAVEELRQSFAAMREELKSEILASLPRVPSAEEIQLQIEEVAAQQVQAAQEKAKRAQAQAAAAQGLAIVALLAGMAGIAAAFLF